MQPGRTSFISALAIWDLLAGAGKLTVAMFAAAFSEGQAVVQILAWLFALWGVLSLAAGHGLWRLRPWGRGLQMVLGVLSLPCFPFGTVMGVVTLVALTRVPIRDLFRGDAITWDEESVAKAKSVGNTGLLWFGGMAAMGVTVLPVVAIISAIAIPNLLNAIDRGKQKRTMADIRTIATALESYAIDHGEYPDASCFDEYAALLEGEYVAEVPLVDGWGHKLRAVSSAEGYVIVSPGKDGLLERDAAPLWDYAEQIYTTFEYEDDIAFANGEFYQSPESLSTR